MQIRDDEGAAPPKTDPAQAPVPAGAAATAAVSPESQPVRAPEEYARLLHALEVHQIELELQNEELRRTQKELESARARYFDLYDMAPVSYLTLSPQGQIQEANLTAATMMGVPRGSLLGQALTRFIAPEDQDSYYRYHCGLARMSAPQVCELRMLRADHTPFWARLEATVVPEAADRAAVYRIVISDITARKRAELVVNRQLRSQVAVARCSQILLQSAPTMEDQRRLLSSTLEVLRQALDASSLGLAQHVADPQRGRYAQVIVGAATPTSPFSPLYPDLQALPWSAVPAAIQRTIEAGAPWGGPLTDLIPRAHAPLLHALRARGIHAVFCVPLFVAHTWWGMLIVADADADRAWSADETLLLTTVAELIGTAIQRWQTEASLAQQLRYAEALSRCSQLLLQQDLGDAERREHLEAALIILRETVGISRLYIYQPPSEMQRVRALNILADSCAPGMPPFIELLPEELRDTPGEVIQRLKAGHWFGCRVAGQFPANPLFQRALDKNGIQSMLWIPVHFQGKTWGILSATDRGLPRDWDRSTVQMLRTAAEMIATFQKGWETTRALREREQALVASEAHLRALRDSLPDRLCVISGDDVLRDYHLPPGVQLPIPPEQVIGRRIDTIIAAAVAAQLLPTSLSAQLAQTCAQVRASGESATFEYSLPVGERICAYEVRIVLVTGGDLLILARDITERRAATEALLRAKEAAEAADRAKSAFVAHVSHELRTPLTAVIGMASLLHETALSPVQATYTATIQTGAETLLHIIGNILDFSKIEAGQLELDIQPFDLRSCLGEALDLVRHTAAHKGLRLSCMIDPALPTTFVGDAGRLRQVLVNLLGNAVKFTARGAVSVTVPGRPPGVDQQAITVVIADTGIGISADVLPHIFEPFLQARSATTRQYGGTGLGLTISRQLLALMGGQIAVTSTPGVGSSFTLTLPLASARSAPTPPPVDSVERAPTAYRPLRILIAEDNPINQQVLGQMLQSLGLTPDVVGSGAAALAAIASTPYDMVLMDIQMPEMDGDEATRQIRALRGIVQPRIIALTASALRGDRERYLAAGMDDYLSKPVQISDLRQLLAHAAARRPPPAALPADQVAPSPTGR